MKKSYSGKKRTLFNPDEVGSKLHQSILSDFPLMESVEPTQLYGSAYPPSVVFSWRQRNEFLKKFKTSTSNDGLQQIAFSKFLSVNRRLSTFNAFFAGPSAGLFLSGRSEPSLVILRRAKNLIHQVLGELSLESWFAHCHHSSGVTIGTKFVKTNSEDKWAFPLSTTKKAACYMDLYLRWNPQLADELQQNIQADRLGVPKYNYVTGSRATTVPKDDSSERFICIEPTVNMFLQQGLRHLIEQRLKVIGLDISTLQDFHKQLASEASITKLNCTVDWSSASDSISTSLVDYLLPREWSHVLNIVRSEFTEINGEQYRLEMISSMGNATTFPLETLIFFSLGVATLSFIDDPSASQFCTLYNDYKGNRVSVFGDDCILPDYAYTLYVDVMSQLGFTANLSKSFSGEVPFRESCGGDFYLYRDVGPLKLKNPTGCRRSDLEPWLYTVWNLATKKYISYFGKLTYVYTEIFKTIADILNSYGIAVKLVPDYFPDDSGLKNLDPRILHYFNALRR